jgi:hypothetical protein
VLIEQAYAGETLTYTVRLADGSLLRASHTLRDGYAPARLAVGATLTVSWQPEACIVLPPE